MATALELATNLLNEIGPNFVQYATKWAEEEITDREMLRSLTQEDINLLCPGLKIGSRKKLEQYMERIKEGDQSQPTYPPPPIHNQPHEGASCPCCSPKMLPLLVPVAALRYRLETA